MILSNVNINEILVEDRAREEMGDIDELIASINKEGLIQPIAVSNIGINDSVDNSTDIKYRLLAGGRRLEACGKAGLSEVPVRIYDKELNSLEVKSIELAENIYRKDFEWNEEVRLKKEIHELQTEIYGEKVTTKVGAPEDVSMV